MADENLKQFKDEIIRHFDIVSERLEDKIQIVAEQVVGNTEQISALREDMSNVKDNIEVIKLGIEVIKNDLK